MIGVSARRAAAEAKEKIELGTDGLNSVPPSNGEALTPARTGWWQAFSALLAAKMEPGQAQPAKRGALIVFSIRVVSAALLFVSQIILARWIGATGYGLYVALWSLVLVVGGLSHLGLGVAMMRMVPEYHASKNFDALRGLLIGGRSIAVIGGLTAASVGALLLWANGASQSPEFAWAAILALACLPAYALTEAQDALGRGQSWTLESVAPPYVLRPALILLGAASSYALAFPANAVTAMACALAATWLTAIVQTLMIQRRVSETVPAGPAVYHFKDWLKVSLPLLTVSGSELILQNADVLSLNALRSPEEVGIYYAAAKTTCLALFVHYAVGSAYSGQFATAGALGDREALRRLTREAVSWTFWPSVAVTVAVLACGPFILSLFGDDFQSAYPAMFILSVGLLARAATGPSEFVLNMLGLQNECAKSFAIAAGVSIALNLALIPFFGAFGAATATACAFATASGLNWRTARRELGLNLFVFGRQTDLDELVGLGAFQPGASSSTWPEVDRRRNGFRRELPPEAQAPLVFNIVHDEAGLDALREDWDRLCANSAAPSNAFLSFEWNRQWLRHYHAGQSHPLGMQMALAVGRRAGRVVIIWPLVTKRMAGMTYLYWMGQPVSQYGDVLIDPTESKFAALRQSWEFILLRLAPDVVTLRKVRADAAISYLLKEKGAMPIRTEQAPYIAFGEDTSFEVFEQRYSAKARKNRRRLLRRLEEKGPVEFVHLSGGDEAAALVKQAIGFKQAWLDERGLLSSALHDARFEKFFAAVSEGPAPCCIVSALKHNGQTCAVMVSVVGGKRLAGHIFAYDVQFEKSGAGVLLLEECLRYALANGYSAFDLLAPGDAYKYDWCEDQVAVTDWAMASSLRGRIFTRLYLSNVREHVKETAKRMPAPIRKVISKALQGIASDAPATAAEKPPSR
jgi:O-antigen/teichoic acid export membrane protein/CelD/BcsL family acetyltransferase involved in cellulose biosynthesis